MITEDYVSFETAKLLKEKGFDEKCYCHYSSDGRTKHWNYQTPLDGIACPTFQMAMKWLIEEHNIACLISPAKEKGFHTNKWHSYVDKLSDNWPKESLWFVETSNSYEEASEAAIKYCLENLI